MTDQSDTPVERDEPLAGIRSDLDALADTIEAQAYPGLAWPVRHGRIRRIVRPLLAGAAAAAAAAIVLAVLLPRDRPAPAPRHARTGPTTMQVASAPAQEGPVWAVPTGIAPTGSGDVALTIPTLTMPSTEDGGMQWDVPSISFPSL